MKKILAVTAFFVVLAGAFLAPKVAKAAAADDYIKEMIELYGKKQEKASAKIQKTLDQLKKEDATLPMIIVSKGKIMNENIQLARIDEKFISNNIKKVGISSIKDILIMTLDNNGKIYVQPKQGKFQTIKTGYTGGNW